MGDQRPRPVGIDLDQSPGGVEDQRGVSDSVAQPAWTSPPRHRPTTDRPDRPVSWPWFGRPDQSPVGGAPLAAPPVPLWRRLVISAAGIPRAWASLGSLALFDWRVADRRFAPVSPRSRPTTSARAAVAPRSGGRLDGRTGHSRDRSSRRDATDRGGAGRVAATGRLPRAAACEVCISTRRVRVNRPASAFAWKHAPPHPPASRRALSLARQRFAEKRASGSRPRRVVRCSCLRQEESYEGGDRTALRHELDRQLDCLAHDFLGDSSIAGARAARPGARLMAVLASPRWFRNLGRERDGDQPRLGAQGARSTVQRGGGH